MSLPRNGRFTPVFRLPLLAALLLTLCTIVARPAHAVDPDVLWSQRYGATSMNTLVENVAVDRSGNVYVVGSYYSATTLVMGSQTLSRLGVRDGFVAKLNSAGTVQWAKTIGGSGATALAQSVTVDSGGNVYVGGYFQTASLTAPAITLSGSRPGFVIKYDSGGNVIRSDRITGTGAIVNVWSLATDTSDNLHIAGGFSSGNLAETITQTLVGAGDGYVAKLNSSGTLQWSRPINGAAGSASINARSLALDSSGNVYVGATVFNDDVVTPVALTRLGGLMLRYTSAGTNDWAQGVGGTGASFNNALIAVDGSGNVFFAGEFSNDDMTIPALTRMSGSFTGFVIKAQRTGNTTSNFSWAKAIDSTSGSSIKGLAVTASGDPVVAGYFTQDLTTPPLTRGNGTAMLVTRLASADGAFPWVTAVRSTTGSGAFGAGVAIDANDNIYVPAYFTGTLTNPALTASGTYDTALFRYGLRHALTVTKSGAGTGTVTADSGSLSCGATCSANYDGGTVVTLTAAAAAGSTFSGWSGNCSGAAATASVTLSAARACTATFALSSSSSTPTPAAPPPPTVQLPISTSGSGQGSVSLASALGNPGPNATYSVQQTSGAALPDWLTFEPATASFSYNVPVPSDLPVQPAAASDGRAGRATPPNLVYPLTVLVQTVPVALTVNGNAYVVNLDFYAPRGTVAVSALSYSTAGRSGDGASGKPAISWDGGQILFETAANNLFSAQSNATKIARYHGLSGNRDLISQTAVPGGGVANASPGPATAPAVTPNGSVAVFAASGGGIVLSPASALKQIYRTGLAYPRVALNEAVTPAPTMVSTSAANLPANAAADAPAVAQDGILVAFESAATNLGTNPDGKVQIWRKNTADGSIVLVSSTATGVAGNGDSRNVSLSWDGRFAAFESTATNLVPGTAGAQVYLKDLATGAIRVIGAGAAPKLDARAASLVFTSQARFRQVMRIDLATSMVTALTSGDTDSDQPTISADGRFVAWRAAGANGLTQIWVRDVFRGQTALVSQTSAGQPGGGNSYDPALSGDGASIAFGSQARDLVNGNPLAGQIHLAGNPLVLPGSTAHWAVTTGGNQAWAIERWANSAYVANLAYQPDGGTATWVAGLCGFADLACNGTLSQVSGGTPAVRTTSTPSGSLATLFTAAGSQATATINGAATQTLRPYPVLGGAVTAMPGLPQGGWWYEPANATSANGVFLQFGTRTGSNGAVSHTSHLSLLSYDVRGVPVWFAAEGTLAGDLSLEGTLYRYAGGAAVGQTAGGAVPSATSVGTFRLTFTASDNATLRLPDGTTRTLARFRF